MRLLRLKRQFQKALYIAVLIGFVSGVNASDTPPNIVIILADDLGWNDVGYHGSEIRTPNIDRLAAEGIVLERFYAQATCTPTRAALLSGKSPQSLGIYQPFSKLIATGLPLTERLLPEYLQDVGYQTALVGKWHLGFREAAYHPLSRGFEHFYGNVTGGVGFWDHVHGGGLDWQRNGATLREEGYATHLSIKEIERVISRRDPQKPLFLYASFNAPHLPNEAPSEAIESYSAIEDPNRRVHAAMVTELDTAIGRLITRLEQEGMLSNTLIWFMSDNGGLNVSAMPPSFVEFSRFLERWFDTPFKPGLLEFIRTNSLDGGSDNGHLRRGKGSVFEGGVRVPSVVHWPAHLDPHSHSSMVTVLDVMPTLLQVASSHRSSGTNYGLDGSDRWLALKEKSEIPVNDYFVSGGDGEAYYRFPWKLIGKTDGELELFNVLSDPSENENLASRFPRQLGELEEALKRAERAESIHVPLLKAFWDMDFFGGEEDRPPWSELTEPNVGSR
ncbi:MAG: sulfatase-like hydrolase/transferase [Gammaproteobacteria bacterium]|nr:sulfatase-like hydrolase/transferase [Gammaproteobacteria bacterium]